MLPTRVFRILRDDFKPSEVSGSHGGRYENGSLRHDDGGSTRLGSVCLLLQDHTVPQPRRLSPLSP